MKLGDQRYHNKCLKCSSCGGSLGTNTMFKTADGSGFLCAKCHKCEGCGVPLQSGEEFRVTEGKRFHTRCLNKK